MCDRESGDTAATESGDPYRAWRFSMTQMLAAVAILAILVNSFRVAPGVLLLLWLVSAGIGAVLSAPIVLLGRRRVHWRLSDGLALVLPFAVWGALIGWNDNGKSLANLIEPLFISPAIPVAASLRLIIGPRYPEGLVSVCLTLLLCILAAAIYCFVPGLPE